ncbi:hypothetical protein BSKO_11151 [Bryopsis sp. KO-2023]|nr:hypothetical protein BSKO_11151 [Bryopsis sp. KO-2023]
MSLRRRSRSALACLIFEAPWRSTPLAWRTGALLQRNCAERRSDSLDLGGFQGAGRSENGRCAARSFQNVMDEVAGGKVELRAAQRPVKSTGVRGEGAARCAATSQLRKCEGGGSCAARSDLSNRKV